MRTRNLGKTGLAATAVAVLLGVFMPVTASAVDPPPNLVVNPSLELGAAFPTCFSTAGFGTKAEWTLVPGHTGTRAVSAQITNYANGDRKLMQTQKPECAPTVQAGSSYDASIWYKSTLPVEMTVFRRTDAGWGYWKQLGKLPAKADWSLATATIDVPAGTHQVSFGIALKGNGTLVTDDYSLTLKGAPAPPPPPPPPPAATTELVTNGWLGAGANPPTCFYLGGWGTRTVQTAIGTDLPGDAPAGSRSYGITVSNYASGDVKLLESDAAGCAPTVKPGGSYDASIRYKSTSPKNSLTVFKHTAAGWAYWTDVKALPASAAWTTATATLPAIPADVDRIAFGISISANGTLVTTGYSLVATPAAPPPPPPGPAGTVGTWTVLGTPLPVRAIHTTLLNDGRLLLLAGSGNSGAQFAAGTFRAVLWNPVANTFKEVPVPYDMFCAGHVTLADGKVLLAGGTETYPTQGETPTEFTGSKKSYYFDPATEQFHRVSDMAGGHWYPSLTKLGNGDVWSAGGIDEFAKGTVITEMFNSATRTWLPQNQVPQTWSYWGTYPHMYLLDDGFMFYSGGHTFGNGLPGTGASIYDWRTKQIWDIPGLRQKDLRDQAGSVLLPPAQDQKVMIVGGGNTNTNIPAINLVDIADLSAAAPTYVPGPDMPGPGKLYVNLVTLPDRTVLEANGATYNRAGDVKTAALYNPKTNAWTPIDSDPVGRNYHSSAILLPDGRVAIFGSNPADNSFDLRISMYSPPYLHKGTRPTHAGAPATATYGTSFQLTVTGEIASASLMSPMSATHQTDTNARLVDLPLAGTGGTRTAQVPNNPNLLPPGPYMLTVLDTTGVPSIATWVWIS